MFQATVLRKYLKAHKEQNAEIISKAYQIYSDYFLKSEIQENIRHSKEEQFQEGFLRKLFAEILGYTVNPDEGYNLLTEQKNVQDSKKADGAIIIADEVRAVIELKDLKTKDLGKVETQAFGYKMSHKQCHYVVTSNFEKLRFYIDNKTEHKEFNLFTLSSDDFTLLHLLLSYDSIQKGLPQNIKSESLSKEDEVTNKLYKDYSLFKRELFADLCTNNAYTDKLTLFKKSQKLLDRLLFIFFAEDKGLLPPNSIKKTIDKWELINSDPLSEKQKLYDRFKLYFNLMNTGNKELGIFAYNGGLFAPDAILDSVIISDNVLCTHIERLAAYDYATDVDVNILGHIFENSLNEIEEVTAEITTGEKQTSKRKKDGVFYTPRYITTYIVQNTIGTLCANKKNELQIQEEDYSADRRRQKNTTIALNHKLEQYRQWLLSLTICDPACGSGAFLNAALDFLIDEHKYIDELTAALYGGGIVFSDIENSILENNLYGVDINEESVEIARLSLWLRTARPQRKLNSLSNNIKCGNSLISDKTIDPQKAFDWKQEFPHIFENGGFDVIVGNPPYGAKLPKTQIKYFAKYYSDWGISESLSDTYFIFYVLSLRNLLSENGMLGFITPNTWKLIESAKSFRKALFDNINIMQIVQHTNKVFADATVDCDTIIACKQLYGENILIRFMHESVIENEHEIKTAQLASKDYINLFLTERDYKLIDKIKQQSSTVKELLIIKNGVKPYEKGKGKPAQTSVTMKEKPYTSEIKIDDSFSPLIGGSLFNRYQLLWNNNSWIKYGEWLAAPRDKEIFSCKEKLIFRQTSDKIIGTYISNGFIMRNNTHIILNQIESNLNLKYALSLLNSKLINYYYWTINPEKGEAMAEVKAFHLGLLPIKNISKEEQVPFIELADKMISLNEALSKKANRFLKRLSDSFDTIKITGALEKFYALEFKDLLAQLKKQKITLALKQQDEWEEYFDDYKTDCVNLSQEIADTDNAINTLVYELYCLTEEEIALVEER